MLDHKNKANAFQAPGRGASAGAGVPGKQTRVEQELGRPGMGGGAKADGHKAGDKAGGAKAGGGRDDDGVLTAQHESDGQIHIITDAGLRHLRQANPKAAKTLFDNQNAYIVLKTGQHMPDGWKGKATVLYPSYADFHAAVEDGTINKSVDAVVYDNEHWTQTPENEKENPSLYAKKFLELARQQNLKFIAAPTRKFLAADAKYADIIDIQLQDREYHTGAYLKAMRHDIRLAHHEHEDAYKKAEHSQPGLAREMNPDIKVVGQITSNVKHLDPGQRSTLKEAEQHAETDIIEGENPKGKHTPALDGFWGYLYQGSHPGPKRKHSVKAGDHILADLAKKEAKGQKI